MTAQKPLCLIAGIMLALPAPANAVSYSLSAHVAVSCRIEQATLTRQPGREQRVLVVTNCNSERFSLQLGGSLANSDIVAAAATAGIATVPGQRNVTILAQRPGRQEISITLSGDADTGMPTTIELTPHS